MPLLIIPSLVKVAVGVAGAAAVAHWVVKETRRLREEVERAKVRVTDHFRREALPTLRRDPATGEWRVM